VIQPLFQVLKKRFPILDTTPQYTFDIERKVNRVLRSLNNFIRILAYGQEDEFYAEPDKEPLIAPVDHDIVEGKQLQNSKDQSFL